MPLYEYACMECESHFEELVRGGEDPPCPACGATKVLRQLSTFVARSARAEAGVAAGPATGGCCGGGCGCASR